MAMGRAELEQRVRELVEYGRAMGHGLTANPPSGMSWAGPLDGDLTRYNFLASGDGRHIPVHITADVLRELEPATIWAALGEWWPLTAYSPEHIVVYRKGNEAATEPEYRGWPLAEGG